MKIMTIASGVAAMLLLSAGAYAQGTSGLKPCPPGKVASRAGDTGNPPDSQTKKQQELARRGSDTGNPPESQQAQAELARRGSDTGNPPDSQMAAAADCQ